MGESNMKIVINGDFYDHKITGVQRYAYEIVRELDNLIEKEKEFSIEVVMPEATCNVPILKNIKIVKYGKKRRFFWQQISLMNYCRRNKAVCVCFCTNVPYLYARNSIQVIHDASTLANPEFYRKKFLIYNKITMWRIAKKLRRIVTVSNFSRREINKYCLKNTREIDVIYNAADHVKRVNEEKNILDKLGLKTEGYCYSLSSLSPNKNFKWIVETAKNNKKERFVISGLKIDLFSNEQFGKIPENVRFTGYVSDSEMVALIKNSKLFLFPTLYEGFGITPLEALTLGKRIVVSDTPCMREIYEGSADFIDPYKYDYDIEELVSRPIHDSNSTLEKYSWRKSAMKFIEIFREESKK